MAIFVTGKTTKPKQVSDSVTGKSLETQHVAESLTEKGVKFVVFSVFRYPLFLSLYDRTRPCNPGTYPAPF
jgi:hypothetical protein